MHDSYNISAQLQCMGCHCMLLHNILLITILESNLFKSRPFKSATSFNNLNHIYVNYWLDFILFFNIAVMKCASLGKKICSDLNFHIFQV